LKKGRKTLDDGDTPGSTGTIGTSVRYSLNMRWFLISNLYWGYFEPSGNRLLRIMVIFAAEGNE
jgi:hypothetical protein